MFRLKAKQILLVAGQDRRRSDMHFIKTTQRLRIKSDTQERDKRVKIGKIQALQEDKVTR